LKTIAEVVVDLMEILSTGDEGDIDTLLHGDFLRHTRRRLAGASPAEQRALAGAAAARLREADEDGTSCLVSATPARRDFLRGLADGSAWHGDFD
jgi:hypothetical protein